MYKIISAMLKKSRPNKFRNNSIKSEKKGEQWYCRNNKQ